MLKMIVVQDPLGEVLPGEVVTGEATAAKLIRRRVVMLPVDDDVGDSAVAAVMNRRNPARPQGVNTCQRASQPP